MVNKYYQKTKKSFKSMQKVPKSFCRRKQKNVKKDRRQITNIFLKKKSKES